jgi:hypothetical protein
MLVVLLQCQSQLKQIVFRWCKLFNPSRKITEFESIIDRCRSFINLYENCRVSYVRQQANRVAYDASCFIASPQFLNVCPPYIESIIINEMN